MAEGLDGSVQLPDTSINTGPKRHVRTMTNLAGESVFEDITQLSDAAENAETRAQMVQLLARLVWLAEQYLELDSSEITVDNV